jgi:sarcosine oxidase
MCFSAAPMEKQTQGRDRSESPELDTASRSRTNPVKYDVAVVGLGAMGSATLAHLAQRGVRAVGVDRLAPPHALGSTHGHTRIIREAYYEHPLYVPLVRRAYELWEQLERESSTPLLRITGGVWVGPERGALVAGALESARTHGIAHELLDPSELTRRFPAYRAQSNWVALHERRAGMLFPERCVEAHLASARRHGAAVVLNTIVTGWTASSRGVALSTSTAPIDAERVVVAPGAWLPELETALGVRVPVEIERQMSHWFDPVAPNARFDMCPVGLWELEGEELFLTMPNEGHGVKCGMHHSGAPTSAAAVERTVSDAENAAARRVLDGIMPGAAGRLRDARVCLYTNTPDRHFIIDRVGDGRIVLLSPCSGHGFKFASAIGEIAADLVMRGSSDFDLTPFSLARFR